MVWREISHFSAVITTVKCWMESSWKKNLNINWASWHVSFINVNVCPLYRYLHVLAQAHIFSQHCLGRRRHQEVTEKQHFTLKVICSIELMGYRCNLVKWQWNKKAVNQRCTQWNLLKSQICTTPSVSLPARTFGSCVGRATTAV